jgi:uncharacterized protein YndB with AHSA1/START domain
MTTPATPAPDSGPTSATVCATAEIAAPPEQVFEALTDPGQLAAWWGSADSYRTHDWKVDARPGGRWSVRTTDASGAEASAHGEYRVVDPPRVLEYTWRASWDGFAPTTVRFELAPAVVGGVSGTRVTVTHSASGAAGVVCCAEAGTGAGADTGAGVLSLFGWRRVLRSLGGHAGALHGLARAA